MDPIWQLLLTMQLFIDTANTLLQVRNKCFFVKNETTQRIISPNRITSIGVTSNITLNASAIKLASAHEIPILFFHRDGSLITLLDGPSFLKQSQLRYKQLRYFNENNSMAWSRHIVILKIERQQITLSRYAKSRPALKQQLGFFKKKLEEQKPKILRIKDPTNFRGSIMGIEGIAARYYYRAINLLLPENFQFIRRSRRPARDHFNALLNYVYGMAYGQVNKAITSAGLDHFTGGLHTTPYQQTLVFDCMEPFRPIWDRLVLHLCAEQKITAAHFKEVSQGIWLNKKGKKMVVPAFVDYLHSRIKLDNKVQSIQNHLYHFARQLKIEILETIH